MNVLMLRPDGRTLPERTILFSLLLCASAALYVSAEESIDRFFVPDSIRSQERLGIPKIDKPVLKKQNFVPEATLKPSEIWNDAPFTAFAPPEYPLFVRLYNGSYASRGGQVRYASPQGWKLDVETESTQGEFANLERERNRFSYEREISFSEGISASGSLEASESVFFGQKKNSFAASSKLGYSPMVGVQLSGGVSWERASVRGEGNDLAAGETLISWQPRSSHLLTMGFAHEQDTAFTGFDRLTTAAAKYHLFLFNTVAAGAGVKYQNSTWYPQGYVAWQFLPGMRIIVSGEPGSKKPRWGDLYRSAGYVAVNPGLLMPEATGALRETFSFYWGKNANAAVEFFQNSEKNYLYWNRVQGTMFVSPANKSEHQFSGWAASCHYDGARYGIKGSVTRRDDSSVPFVPEYAAHVLLELRVRLLTLQAGGDYLSERRYSYDTTDTLSAAPSLSLGAAFAVTKQIEMFVKGENIAGRKIELQPGFWYESPVVSGGLKVTF